MLDFPTLDDQVRTECFLKVAKNMLKKNFSFNEILELIPDLSKDQLEELKVEVIKSRS